MNYILSKSLGWILLSFLLSSGVISGCSNSSILAELDELKQQNQKKADANAARKQADEAFENLEKKGR
jgi:hypothetical protein